MLYVHPIDAVTNYHKHSGINNTNLLPYRSGGQKCHWIKFKVWTGLCSFWRLQGRTCSSPLPASRGCLHSVAHGCFLSSKAGIHSHWRETPSVSHSEFTSASSRVTGALPCTLLQDHGPSYFVPCYWVWHGCHYWFTIIEREASYFLLGILTAIKICWQQGTNGNLVMVWTFSTPLYSFEKN